MQSSHCGVFSCCGAWTLRCLGFCSRGAQALLLWHVEFSWTRDETCVPCTGRQILNHWTTRKSTVSPRTVGREGEARAPEKGLGGPFFIPSCFSHELERPWCWSTKILFLIYMRRGLEMISKACFYSDMVGSQDQAFWSIEVGSNLLFIMTFFWIVWLQFGHPQRIKCTSQLWWSYMEDFLGSITVCLGHSLGITTHFQWIINSRLFDYYFCLGKGFFHVMLDIYETILVKPRTYSKFEYFIKNCWSLFFP